ncbi:MAG: hypothetical protein ACLFUS_12185 [Candidatus Sumerlaeia bacterium]
MKKRIMFGKGWMLLILVFGILAAPALAADRAEMEESVIEWAGSGPNTAYVVIDFDDYSTASREFAFGVRFTSPTITGREAMDMLTSETSLQYGLNNWGMMSDMWYTYKGRTLHGSGEFPPWWSYWTSDDYGTSWTFASVGFDTRELADGDVDGWLNTMDTGWPVQYYPNGPRTTPRVSVEEDVIERVGSGSNTAYVLVDFSDSTTSSAEFVFAVNFTSPTITGRQAMDIITSETSLQYGLDNWGMMSDMWYTHRDESYHGSGEFPPWWSYWTSENCGTSWTFASVGFDARELADGDMDGWLNSMDTGWPISYEPNGPRVTPRSVLESDVLKWVGSGEKTAYVVVDFDDSSTQSAEFVFGVQFTSRTITGQEAMDIIKAETNLDYGLNNWGMMSDIWYNYYGMQYHGSGEFPPWWSYWTSEDYSMNWSFSSVGYTDRLMQDGSVDGWLNTMDTGWPVKYSPNGPRKGVIAPASVGVWNLYE